jgi:RNA polymerase sigma factor (sigma-70 family)
MQKKSLKSLSDADLWQRYQQDRSAANRNLIADRNQGLVRFVVNRYATDRVDVPDLIQEGSLALLGAIERFDLSLGFAFSTYACRCIWGRIAHYYRDKHNLIKVPRNKLPVTCLSLNQAMNSDDSPDFVESIAVLATIEPSEDHKWLHDEIALLAPQQRQAIELYYLQDLTQDKCHKIMGVAHMTFRSKLTKGIAALQEKFYAP